MALLAMSILTTIWMSSLFDISAEPKDSVGDQELFNGIDELLQYREEFFLIEPGVIDSPEETAINCIEQLNDSEVDLKILLYHGTYDNALEIVRKVPDIDLVIVGHEQRLIEQGLSIETFFGLLGFRRPVYRSRQP